MINSGFFLLLLTKQIDTKPITANNQYQRIISSFNGYLGQLRGKSNQHYENAKKENTVASQLFGTHKHLLYNDGQENPDRHLLQCLKIISSHR